MSFFRPPCPRCNTPVGWKRIFWGLGSKFQCRNCDAWLMMPRNFWIGLGAFMAWWVLEKRTDDVMLKIGLAVVLGLIVLLVQRLVVLPRQVEPD
ncbi:hypothetical protein [Qipengyuania aquimaris]|uniref:hypothetical protein n=1 Tax=Qipengyuania aquimaris TaxID=255984 RepID=UPI001FD2A7CA|nr:hypothetical protein [Qipengyuania aquimaris]UOR15442.1 hypothetical protein LCM05_13325 [Qipengyuania aquimaris]